MAEEIDRSTEDGSSRMRLEAIMSSRNVYVDETKQSGYVMVVVTVRDPPAARRTIQGLILPGQRRLHMHGEQARRRGVIVSAVVALNVSVTVYDAGRNYGTDFLARAACLAALVGDLAAAKGDTRLMIERDESLVRFDKQRLIELTRNAGVRDTFHYDHLRAFEEPLLALPDVVAWCWARTTEWRRRVRPLVADVRCVRP
jgi:hypothetical protein